jgi:hypothetical protein
LLDLNPIEYLWNEIDHYMRMSKKKPTYEKDLWKKLQEIWNSIEVHIVRKLIIFMPQRVVNVYQARSGYIYNSSQHECFVVVPLNQGS